MVDEVVVGCDVDAEADGLSLHGLDFYSHFMRIRWVPDV